MRCISRSRGARDIVDCSPGGSVNWDAVVDFVLGTQPGFDEAHLCVLSLSAQRLSERRNIVRIVRAPGFFSDSLRR